MNRFELDEDELTPAVARFVAELHAFADVAPPDPNDELAAVLAGAVPLDTARRRTSRRRIAGLAAAAVLVTGTGVAAAQGRLPQPAQRLVSDVVDTLTPFRVPSRAVPDAPGPTQRTAPVPAPPAGDRTPVRAARHRHRSTPPAPGPTRRAVVPPPAPTSTPPVGPQPEHEAPVSTAVPTRGPAPVTRPESPENTPSRPKEHPTQHTTQHPEPTDSERSEPGDH